MTSAISSDKARHTRWSRVERVLAGLAVFDGLLGLAICIFTGNASGTFALLSLLGMLAGTMVWRGRRAGHLAALVFYGLQLATYHPFDVTVSYRLGGALNLGAIVYLPNAVVVLNVFAIAMFAASAALLLWRSGDAISTNDSGEA